MTRDAEQLRRNLRAVCPTLSQDDLGMIIEALGDELLGRGIWQGVQLAQLARELLGWQTPPRTYELALPASGWRAEL